MSSRVTLLKSGLDRSGGLEKYTFKLAQAFRDVGADVHILTTGTPSQLVDGVTVHSLCPRRKISLWHLIEFETRVQQFLSKNPSKIVFGLDRNLSQTHYRAGNGLHRTFLEQRALFESPLKGLMHAFNPLHRYLLYTEKRAFEAPELKTLFTNSEMVRQEILKAYRVEPKKVVAIHNGVGWKAIAEDFQNSWDHRSRQMNRFDLNPHAHQLLFVGHGFQRKGLPLLLKALAPLRDSLWQLSVIGHDSKVSDYQTMCAAYGIQDRVRFWGVRNDVHAFYQIADTFLIPSWYDPFANVTLEALSWGTFVLSSPFNGAKEVIQKGAGGVIGMESQAWSQALEERMEGRKNEFEAREIRESVRSLDFAHQLQKIVTQTGL
jgi:Glycosyltransferase